MSEVQNRGPREALGMKIRDEARGAAATPEGLRGDGKPGLPLREKGNPLEAF